MRQEQIRLRPRKGEETVGQADITTLSAGSRGLKVGLWLLFGVAGLGTIVIPGMHFVTPWLIPLISLGMAWNAWNKTHILHKVSGECPLCGETGTWTDVVWDTQLWERCPHCNEPIEIILAS